MQMRFALFALFSLILTGCTTARLEELRHAEPKGTPFQNALAAEYLAFAEAEAKSYDWWSMSVFSQKGLASIYGNEPQPELVRDWNVPTDMIPEFEAARSDLLEALNTSNKQARPSLTARAQFFYDCWLEQQEEGWQQDDIKACRNGFFDAMNRLKGASPEAPAPISSSSYLILFDSGKASLNTEGESVVRSVAQEVSELAGYEILLSGYTDRAGSSDANMSLSQKRVESVRNALVKQGVPANAITEFAYGESKPRATTKDGVRERSNRRVEIFIQE
jgi:OOP family OmpA-OmpF porin